GLAEHFLRRSSAKNKRLVRRISPEAMRRLEAHDWPGNVRELENAVEYAVVFGETDEIRPEDLPEKIAVSRAEIASSEQAIESSSLLRKGVKSLKAKLVSEALERANGNYTAAAKILGVHPNNLHRLIRTLKLGPISRASGGPDSV